MDPFETLKQFKNITPDPANKEKSKRAILATLPHEPLSAWRVVTRIFETGIAVALTVFFILVVTGQFSNTPYVSPVKFAVINPETLHAEAQAVDIQIQLAQVAYQESTSTLAIANETTPEIATASGISPAARSGFAPMALRVSGVASSSTDGSAPADEAAATSTAASTTVSVDQALQALSQ